MPVIGRLDEQVDDVLISPVAKRRPNEGEPPRGRGRTHGDVPDNQDEPAERASRDETAEPAARDELESDAVRDELPVWLL